jgi:D-alanyl-D-alanine carboxypeptidase
MTSVGQLADQAELGALASDRLQAVDAPGAVVALSVDGEPWSTGIGHTDLQRQYPIEADARFSLYSITKTVIATMILRLIEGRESIVLDDTLQAYFPLLPIETPVPIRHVLNHTSGLSSYGTTREYHDAIRAHPDTPWTDDEFLERTIASELLFLPGHGWRYSNIGYLLLRQLLEQETGVSFPNIVRSYLGRPFSLESFSGAATLDDVQGLTPGYSSALSANGAVENVVPHYHPGWVSHGLVTSNAADVATFLDLLFEPGKLVEPSLLEQMLIGAPVAETHAWMVNPAYGLGLMIDIANPFGVVAGHTGGGPGYSTAAYHFPDVHGHKVSSIALVNRDGSDVATDIAFAMVQRLASNLA